MGGHPTGPPHRDPIGTFGLAVGHDRCHDPARATSAYEEVAEGQAPGDDLPELAVPGVTPDDELDAFAFFAAGDHRETFVTAMRDAAGPSRCSAVPRS